MKRVPLLVLLALLGSAVSGCRMESESAVAEFEPNWVFAYQMAKFEDQPKMEQALSETGQALSDLFGTPDEPKIPEFVLEDDVVADLVSLDHLRAASGPVGESGRGLYRQHCATCHGVTGNGRGPTAALLNPYPRDYRLGRFKFKSTPIGAKPTKEDLKALITNGISGTTMVKIPELTEQNVDALVDYVIYLSWRGEVERSLLMEGAVLDFADEEEPESLYRPALKDSSIEEQREEFEDQWALIEDFVLEVAENWVEAPDRIKDVPSRDPSLVPDTAEEVLVAMQSEGDSEVKESVARGKELFLAEKASCSKCHGKEGRGDGQTNDYDEWAKDWTSKFGLDPQDEAEHYPLIARGALPVRKVSPRNFSEGVFRGGNSPEQLYQRIALGIEGTPMPAAAVEPAEIWDLVNYVRSLYEPKQEESGDNANQTPEQVAVSTR